jgi:hypothetical protein
MSDSCNVHVICYDDVEMLRDCVASIPDGVDIHVCDGRYTSFDGDRDVTPAIERFATRHSDCRYHTPPADRLPFGHDVDAPLEHRPGVHAKAAWVNHEVLPQDEWTVKLDADERLEAIDVNVADLDDRRRYCPTIRRKGEGECFIARLWQPQYWTAWIDDCLLPREVFPRSTSLERLARVYLNREYRPLRFAYRQELPGDIVIKNVGVDRPTEYQGRRVKQLERIGRGDRAATVASLVDDA